MTIKLCNPKLTSENDTEEELATEDFSPICGEDPIPLIPNGEYEAQYIRHERKQYLRKQIRLYIWMRIITSGQYSGLEFYMAINMTYNKIGRGMKYYQEWTKANGGRPPKRGQRMSLAVFKNKVFQVRIRKANSKRNYSVIDEIIESLTGGGVV